MGAGKSHPQRQVPLRQGKKTPIENKGEDNMSKKMLSLTLALVLCLGLTLPACAAEKTDSSVNAAGSTTVTDTGGKTHTLSSPVLYTISGSDIEKVRALWVGA